MTAHEFAKQLLEGPDLPTFVPAVVEYDDSDESAKTPIVSQVRGERTDTDESCDLLMISYLENAEVSHGDRERQPDTHSTHKSP